MIERTLFISDDGKEFDSKLACEDHERRMAMRVTIPMPLIEEAIRQCTPYMISAKERKMLKLQLEMWRDAAAAVLEASRGMEQPDSGGR